MSVRTSFLFIVVFYCFYNVIAQEKRFRFDYKYYQESQGWFKLHRIPANWKDARLRCHLEGAVLASPIKPTLQKAIQAIMTVSEIENATLFTGISATFSKGDYFSIEGIPLARIPLTWAPGEPNNLNDEESCIIMHSDGTIADVKCEKVFPYICFKKDTNIVINACGTSDNEYNLDSRTGSCYKFHRQIMRWSRAYMTCAAEGGYLAIINSEQESEIFKNLFSKYPAETIIGTQHRSIALIGVHDWDEHGSWRTIHGNTIEEEGFSKFENNEPSNHTTGEFCGSMYRTGLMNDIYCNDHLVFICEKSPDSLL